MWILLSCSHVSTIVWLQHLDFNRVPGEKARWELHKDAVCCFEQILETTPNKTPTPTPHLNYLSKIDKTCWILLERQRQSCERHSPVDSYTWTHHCWPISKDLRSSALCRHWMLSRGPTKSEGWEGQMARESQKNPCYQHDDDNIVSSIPI